jgi:hypothetical protein
MHLTHQPPTRLALAAALLTPLAAQSAPPQHLVAPAAYTTTDALAYEWIAGASQPLRQQTLVGQSHLGPLIGQTITAIELRRTAVLETYQPGSMHLAVALSTSPNTPIRCSNVWASNVGPDVTTVFTGTVSLPASPPATGYGLGTPVTWTPDNTLRIAFAQPFPYQGGTLCVDVTGTPIAGLEANWWMADAAEEVILGSATVEIGAGCGSYGGPNHDWSAVAERTLVPGMRAQFWAHGTPNGLGLAVFGAAAGAPIPLAALGLPRPGCTCYIDLGLVLAVIPAVFEPEVHPSAAVDAIAEVLVAIPPSPTCFGMQLTTQWLDLAQLATSNAITWTVAPAIPSLDMALNEGPSAAPNGLVTPYLAHVLRFEYQ